MGAKAADARVGGVLPRAQLGVDGIFAGIVGLLARADHFTAPLANLRLLSLPGNGRLDRGVLAVRPRDRAEAAVRAVLSAAAVGVNDAVVVLGVLVEIFGGYAVAGRGGIARHGQILLQHLVGIAADADVRPVAVESLLAGIAAAIMRTTRPAATRAPVVGSLSHIPIASGNRPDAPGSEAVTPTPCRVPVQPTGGDCWGATG